MAISRRTPLYDRVSFGIGGLARGVFTTDNVETTPVDYDILITEDGFDLTDETTEATLEP